MIRRSVLMGQRLWQQAERDIEVARGLLQPGTYYAAANFAHQAAEKALKAACWHLRGEEPPWKHDLVRIADLLVERIGNVPPAVREAVDGLHPMFMESRYPSGDETAPIPADLIDEGNGRLAVKWAEEVMSWVRTLLQGPPGSTRRRTS